jgi:hypothetical protein
MFDELDDPTPPRPTGTTRIRVHARAAKLRRRTNAIRAGTSAVAILLLVGVLAVFARRNGGEELDTGPIGPVTTTVPVDLDRGEVLDLDATPFGGTLVERRTMNDPEVSAFDRTFSFKHEAGGTFGVTRIETSATDLIAMRERLGAPAGSVNGRTYYLNPDDPNQLYWFVSDNIMISIGTQGGVPPGPDLLASLVYEPPEVRCVTGEVVRSDGPCAKETSSEPVGAADHTTVDVTGS